MIKTKIAVLFGGPSSEHEVSILSAANVYNCLDDSRFDKVAIGITRTGEWYEYPSEFLKLASSNPRDIPEVTPRGDVLACLPGRKTLAGRQREISLDVVFPVLHGPVGEDGRIQGLISCLGTACVGSDTRGSAICFDKDITKRMLRDSDVPVADWLTLRRSELRTWDITQVERQLGFPVFVKPASMGSSVGISKARDLPELGQALKEAFRFDEKILIEKAISGREIEVAVIGGPDLAVSLAGEVIAPDHFYSYDAKYCDNTAQLVVPTELDEETYDRIKAMAKQVFTVTEARDLARVDFFVTDDGGVMINEVNTMPGFTPISLYPKLWEISGIAGKELVGRLVDLAMARHAAMSKLSMAPD